MGKSGRLVVATLLVVVFAGLGAWWVLGDAADGGAETARPTAAAPRDVAPAVLPVPPQPVAGGDTPDAAPERLTARPDAAPTALPAEPGVPVRFSGRVVDTLGQPVAGATVRVLPSARLLKALGVRLGPFEPPLDVERFKKTTSAADGTFTLDARDVPAEQASLAEHPTGYASFEGFWPELLVSHPAFEATARACIGCTGAVFAAGDVVLGPGASVIGRAVDEDGQPLADVLVRPPPLYNRWQGTPGNVWDHARALLVTRSSKDGTFRLDSLWPGEMSLQLEAPGRACPVQQLVLLAGEVHDLGDVVVGRGGTLDGWVLDAQSGGPVPGARVLVRPPIGELFKGPDSVAQAFASKVGTNDVLVDHETHATEEGAFSVTGLDPATKVWDVFAGGPGYEPVKLAGVAADAPPVSLALQRAGLIVLTVLDPDTQEPILDATMTGRRHASDEEYNYTKLEVVSDPQALAALGLPPPFEGVYALTPAGSHRNDAIVSAPGRVTRGFELPVVTAPERASRTIHLGHELLFAGHVVDPDGAPIADAKLTLHAPEDLRVALPDREARTDAGGRFRFDALLDGDWDLTASAPRFVTSEPQRVALRKGQAAPDAEIVLQHAGAIAGVVTAAGAPQSGLEVFVRSSAALAASKVAQAVPLASGGKKPKPTPKPPSWKALTGADGRFLIESLPPDEYELTGPPGVSLKVGVASGKTTEVTVLARRRPRVHGRVVDADGPVAGAKVAAARHWGGHGGWLEDDTTATSEADGSYVLEMYDPETYNISARYESISTEGVELAVDWDADEWLELRFGAGSIAGLAVDDAGKPVAAASVSLWRVTTEASTGESHSTSCGDGKSDAEGHFAFARLSAGHYAVQASAPQHVSSERLDVTMPENARAPDVSLVLPLAATLRGVLKPALPGGELPEQLAATLTCSDPATAKMRVNLKADGTFSSDHVPAGHWTCDISTTKLKNGPVLASCELDAVAGEVVDVSLQLAP